MSNQLPFTTAPADPQLKDVLDQLKKNIFLSLNCHHIGTIQSFDAVKQTATVTINYKKTINQLDVKTGVYAPVLRDYPVCVDSPVIVLGGGTTALTFPIQQGDECLVLFNDRDMDNWFSGIMNTGVNSVRQHSFADSIVLVGLRSMPNVLSDYDTTRAVLRNGTTVVGVGATLIKIANAVTSLGAQLQDLITAIENLVVNPGTMNVGGTPVTGTGTVSSTVAPTLSTISTELGGLLE